jgi:hypothetical protein
MFDFPDVALPQEPFKMTGYEDFTMDETTSHMMFSSMPWLLLLGWEALSFISSTKSCLLQDQINSQLQHLQQLTQPIVHKLLLLV